MLLFELFNDVIKDELNVKTVNYIDDVSKFTSYKFKPNFKTLGSKCGKLLGPLGKILATIDGHKAMDELNETGKLFVKYAKRIIALETSVKVPRKTTPASKL